MSSPARDEFSGWRSYIWPVYGFELKKLLPMFLMFFCISFNYTILRDTKDTLIVTARGSGAEAIPFIKFWCVLPSAVIFMLVYSKLSNMLRKDLLFYISLCPFLVFFAAFSLIIYPNRDLLHPVSSADHLATILPKGLGGLVSIYRNWTYVIFYVLAELWGSVGISLLFWGFANETTKISEAKRFYTVFGLGANLALLFSGPIIVKLSSFRKTITDPSIDAWGMSLNYLMAMVVLSGLVCLGLYYYMNEYVLKDPRFAVEEKKTKNKVKMGVRESLKFLLSQKYIACLSLLVMSYGVLVNIYEVTWKSQIKVLYPDPSDYSTFMGHFSTTVGLMSLIMIILVGGNVLRKFGWYVTAMFTPVVLLISGTLFFTFIIFSDYLSPIFSTFGYTPVFLAVMIGAFQNMISKSTKYAMFDPTKEMAYIPLEEETRVKGKVAVDVVGARLGKSGGAIIQQSLLLLFGSLGAITVSLFFVSILIGMVWISALGTLNKEFLALQKK